MNIFLEGIFVFLSAVGILSLLRLGYGVLLGGLWRGGEVMALPLRGGHPSIEMEVRKLKFKSGGGCHTVLVDCGMDEETRSSARRLCGSYGCTLLSAEQFREALLDPDGRSRVQGLWKRTGKRFNSP